MSSAAEVPPESLPLAEGYCPTAYAYDEMYGADGQPRPHWRQILSRLEALGPRGLNDRWQTARRLLHENGITYNVHGDPDGLARPWELDPVPLVIAADEWACLEEGLIQRARLLEAVLRDLYGPQKLVKEGHIPAALVFGNPGFLRPCHGAEPPGGHYLHFYAVDLARSPDGQWWVLSDRAQAPVGAGYALENRIVLTRALPEPFRECHVRRLASFFQTMRDNLFDLAPRGQNLLAVLLSPGPSDEAYFEHAYLARYLGLVLVEGADLTVRDNRVFLKTIGGLKQVDVIVRRVEDALTDPLELDDSSVHGVAGLVQAARAGQVVMANALGSGVAECRGLMAFLPALSRHVLGEDLKIPNVATWWCGDEAARDHVLSNLENLEVASAFGGTALLKDDGNGTPLRNMTPASLRARLLVRGFAYVGQETIRLSNAPVLSTDGRLTPRPVALRAYVAAHGDSFVAMPGGLARFSDEGIAHSVALQRGEGSKDTWVLADGPVSSFSLLRPPGQAVPLRRAGGELPSRAADNLFWLGRYAERAEGAARVLRGLVAKLTGDSTPAADDFEIEMLLNVLAEEGHIPPRTARRSRSASGRGGETFEFDPKLAEGLKATLHHLHRTASLVRDRLSLDAWRSLNRLGESVLWPDGGGRVDLGQGLADLDEMILTMAAFSGMEMENMTRGPGWLFLDMGRRAERAVHIAILLRCFLVTGDPEADGSLELLLALADSFMTYRSRYLANMQLPPVLDLLLTDDTNPRSVAFQIAALEEHVARLPRDADDPRLSAEERIIARVRTDLKLANVERLAAANPRGTRAELQRFLTRFESALPEFSEALARTYFSHADRVAERSLDAPGTRGEAGL